MFQHMGSVSHGTMRAADLIPAQFDTLLELDPIRGVELWASWRQELWEDWGVEIAPEPGAEGDWEGVVDAIGSETPYFILEELGDALTELAPPGVYFGSHPGDGADVGFWPDFDGLDNGEYPKVGDPGELDNLPWDATEAVEVNERGNVTFYVAERAWRPVRSV
jgi:hypothetical protein